MTRPKVIVTRALPPKWLEPLRRTCELTLGPAERAGIGPEVEPALSEAEGILSMLTERIDTDLLARAPNLKVVSNMAVGVDNVDLAACSERGIPVGHTPGVLTDATADLTIALLLATARRLGESSRDARDGLWGIWTPTGWLGRDLRNKTLGIVGLGAIGAAVARRARAFGMHVIAHSRTPKPTLEAQLRIERVAFDELLERSDFVSIHTPLTPETSHLFDAAAFEAMRTHAILINTARGKIVDHHALLDALRHGVIAGAGLDVTEPEPLPPDHPLYAVRSCFITPHVGSATLETRAAMADLACRNLLSGLAGRRLEHCANPDVYGADP